MAVSLSHFFSWPLERCVAFLLDTEAALCRSRKRGGQQVRQFMGTWANHVQSWADQAQIPVLLLRYEELLVQPEQEFGRLATFLDLPAEKTLIQDAVAHTR
ncbi:MAG: sulfotransferase domain-containing protein, partial [bacterium]